MNWSISRSRLAAVLVAVVLLAVTLLVAAPAFADTPTGGTGTSGDPYTNLSDPPLPTGLISCPADLKPPDALLMFCIEFNFSGGTARFGSVSSNISGPIVVQEDVAVKIVDGQLTPVPVDTGGSGGGGGFAFPPIDIPGGIVGNPQLNALLKPVTGVTATIEPTAPLAITGVDALGFLSYLTGSSTGPFTLATATIPFKVQVKNLLLGNTCDIGSASNPITLNLPLTLDPPEFWRQADPAGTYIEASADATDGTFSIPAAKDCGLLGVGPLLDNMNLQQINLFDILLNQTVGLPAPSGTNLVSLQGEFGLTLPGADGSGS